MFDAKDWESESLWMAKHIDEVKVQQRYKSGLDKNSSVKPNLH